MQNIYEMQFIIWSEFIWKRNIPGNEGSLSNIPPVAANPKLSKNKYLSKYFFFCLSVSILVLIMCLSRCQCFYLLACLTVISFLLNIV